MLNYKVSYGQEWDKEGTHYSQMITISIPNEQILKHLVNAKIRAYKGIHQVIFPRVECGQELCKSIL